MKGSDFGGVGGFGAVSCRAGGRGEEGGVIDCGGVPARGMLEIDPAGTLTMGEIVPYNVPNLYSGEYQETYERMVRMVKDRGLVDHVGSNNYTVWEFLEELRLQGVNRRVPPAFIRSVAMHLPLPIMFTHSKVPVFNDAKHLESVFSYIRQVKELSHSEPHFGANWLRGDWGMYSDQGNGGDNAMIDVYQVMHRLERKEYQRVGAWVDLETIFREIRYEEQPIAMSWVTDAIKIVGKDTAVSEKDMNAGIRPAIAVDKEEIENG